MMNTPSLHFSCVVTAVPLVFPIKFSHKGTSSDPVVLPCLLAKFLPLKFDILEIQKILDTEILDPTQKPLIIFTSVFAVQSFAQALETWDKPALWKALPNVCTFAAVGPATAKRVQQTFLTAAPVLTPPNGTTGLAALLQSMDQTALNPLGRLATFPPVILTSSNGRTKTVVKDFNQKFRVFEAYEVTPYSPKLPAHFVQKVSRLDFKNQWLIFHCQSGQVVEEVVRLFAQEFPPNHLIWQSCFIEGQQSSVQKMCKALNLKALDQEIYEKIKNSVDSCRRS